jgi:uncharacterized protein
MTQVLVERSLRARMRDGVLLASDVYRPDLPGRFPAIVLRVPYNRARFGADLERGYGHYLARNGFVVVIQDTRGRFESEGDFSPLLFEEQDGFDTIEWAARLPWSTGQVGTTGQSYYAATQYLLAPARPPHLVACAPISAPSDWRESWVYRTGGALELGWLLPYAIIGLGFENARRSGKLDLLSELVVYFGLPAERFLKGPGLIPLEGSAYSRVPVVEWANLLAPIAPYLRDYFDHVEDSTYWNAIGLRSRYRQITAPMLHIGSWYDLFLEGTLANFTGLQRSGGDGARGNQKMLIGPWVHRPLSDPYTHPTSVVGDVDFGPEAAIELLDVLVRWFNHWLKGVDTGLMSEPAVSAYVMGANRWRSDSSWPPSEARFVPLFLHGTNGPGGRQIGRLSWDPPGTSSPHQFVYDPSSPTPTIGGSALAIPNGIRDQSPLEARSDILAYTSDPLERELEITGPLSAILFAASSSLDTDFVVRLIDVLPDGRAWNIQDGIIRARYREDRDQPRVLKPGHAYQFTVDMWATSYLFKHGHRIRVHIASASFPRFDRNLNVAEHPLTAKSGERATQTIFHDRKRPSHILLPVVS